MRKISAVAAAIIILAGCVTNPYEQSDLNAGRQPMTAGGAYLTGILPGLTQFVNGEWIEAILYFGSMYGAVMLQGSALGEDGSIENEVTFGIANAAILSIFAWSYIDGIANSKQRYQTFLSLGGVPRQSSSSARASKQLYIGMSREQLLQAWGSPQDINRSVGAWGVHEQFVYGKDYANRVYIYVENGKVTSWQD